MRKYSERLPFGSSPAKIMPAVTAITAVMPAVMQIALLLLALLLPARGPLPALALPMQSTPSSWTSTTSPSSLGSPPYSTDKIYPDAPPAGVVMGLAWTPMGGSVLYIETVGRSFLASHGKDRAAGKGHGRVQHDLLHLCQGLRRPHLPQTTTSSPHTPSTCTFPRVPWRGRPLCPAFE